MAHEASILTARRQQSALFLAVCGLGISAAIVQLTLMRELVSALSGNELVLGVVLGSWFLLTGIGAMLGRTARRVREPLALLIPAQMAVALLPIADVLLVRCGRDVVFLRGVEPGVTGTVTSVLVLLAPYCLVMGYLLPLACALVNRGSNHPPSNPPSGSDMGEGIGRVYFLDSAGGIVGGLVFTFVLVWWFDPMATLCLPALLNLCLAGVVAIVFRRWRLAAGVVISSLVPVGIFWPWNLETLSTRLQYPGQAIRFQGNSPYGRLTVTERDGQLNFISSGVVLFSTRNTQQAEETVHYAMAQRPTAKSVLLISGGASGTANEILKYPVERIDTVELDPLIVEAARRIIPETLKDPRIEVIQRDGRRFVQQSKRRYDVVIIDMADPSTWQLNRFYTQEFFACVRRILRPGGVLSVAVGRYENYLSPELTRLIEVTHATLREVYGNVEILPGSRLFFVASDGPLTANASEIATRLARRGVATRFVRPRDLDGTLAPDRLADVRRAIRDGAATNRDFNPILYYHHLRYWMSQYQVRFGVMEGVLVALALVYLVRLRPVSLVIFTGGFAASALEIVVMLAFQVLYGSVYHRVGILVVMFMMGLAVGSYVMNRALPRWQRPGLAWLATAVAVYAALLPAALWGLAHLDESAVAAGIGQAAMALLTLLVAVLVGMEFPLAARIQLQSPASTASQLYTADYMGAALGALLVSTLLIPLLGVVTVCLLAAGLNFAAGGVILATGTGGR